MDIIYLYVLYMNVIETTANIIEDLIGAILNDKIFKMIYKSIYYKFHIFLFHTYENMIIPAITGPKGQLHYSELYKTWINFGIRYRKDLEW